MVRISSRVAHMKWLLSICCCMMPHMHALFTTYQAYQAYEQGNVQTAVELFGACAAQNQHDWHSLYNLGTIALNQEQYTEAIKHFEKVLELQPEHDSARERLTYARRRAEEQQQKKEQQQKQDQQKKSESEQQSSPQKSSDESSPNQQDEQNQKQNRSDNSSKSDIEEKNQAQSENAAQQQSTPSQKERSENTSSQLNNAQKSGNEQSTQQQQQNSPAPACKQQDCDQPGNNAAAADLLEQQLSKSEQQLLHATDEIDREAQKQLLYRALVQDHKEGNAKTTRHNW
jgi:Ca-activated chloride channel family protein